MTTEEALSYIAKDVFYILEDKIIQEKLNKIIISSTCDGILKGGHILPITSLYITEKLAEEDLENKIDDMIAKYQDQINVFQEKINKLVAQKSKK